MNRIYLAGPMSKLPEHNFPRFRIVTAQLRALGWQVTSPVEICEDASLPWGQLMRADIRAMLLCDELVLLEGWESSDGALLELAIAHRVGMPIRQLRDLLQEHADDKSSGR